MKTLIGIGLLFLLLAGSIAAAQDDITAQQTLIERLYHEVYEEGNLNIISEIVAEDYIDHNQTRWPTRDGIAHSVKFLHDRLPDLTVGVIHWYFKDDHVVVQVAFSGTLEGRAVHWIMLDAYRIDEGQLAEAWHLPLTGTTPPPPPDLRSSEVSL